MEIKKVTVTEACNRGVDYATAVDLWSRDIRDNFSRICETSGADEETVTKILALNWDSWTEEMCFEYRNYKNSVEENIEKWKKTL